MTDNLIVNFILQRNSQGVSPIMGEDTSSDQVPDPRNCLSVLRSLNFQGYTEYLGETASIGETTRLADS